MATATIPGTSARGKRRNRKVESAKKNLTGNATNQNPGRESFRLNGYLDGELHEIHRCLTKGVEYSHPDAGKFAIRSIFSALPYAACTTSKCFPIQELERLTAA